MEQQRGLKPAALLKKRLQQRCFPVNFVKFFKTPFYRSSPVTDSLRMNYSNRQILMFSGGFRIRPVAGNILSEGSRLALERALDVSLSLESAISQEAGRIKLMVNLT